jgi:hypothetical protein
MLLMRRAQCGRLSPDWDAASRETLARSKTVPNSERGIPERETEAMSRPRGRNSEAVAD